MLSKFNLYRYAPEKGPKLFDGGEALVGNVERLVKMFISLSRGTPDDWGWEGMLLTAVSTAAGLYTLHPVDDL